MVVVGFACEVLTGTAELDRCMFSLLSYVSNDLCFPILLSMVNASCNAFVLNQLTCNVLILSAIHILTRRGECNGSEDPLWLCRAVDTTVRLTASNEFTAALDEGDATRH